MAVAARGGLTSQCDTIWAGVGENLATIVAGIARRRIGITIATGAGGTVGVAFGAIPGVVARFGAGSNTVTASGDAHRWEPGAGIARLDDAEARAAIPGDVVFVLAGLLAFIKVAVTARCTEAGA